MGILVVVKVLQKSTLVYRSRVGYHPFLDFLYKASDAYDFGTRG